MEAFLETEGPDEGILTAIVTRAHEAGRKGAVAHATTVAACILCAKCGVDIPTHIALDGLIHAESDCSVCGSEE